jgi:hypothetical protein
MGLLGPDGAFAREPFGGRRMAQSCEVAGRSERDDFATIRARARSEIEKPVSRSERGFIVFHEDDGVSRVTDLKQAIEELLRIERVEAGGRLIEDVANARESGAELRGQANALEFATGEGGCAAVEREVGKPDTFEEGKPREDFALEWAGDGLKVGGDGPSGDALAGGEEIAGDQIGERDGAEFDAAGGGVETRALACGAGLFGAEGIESRAGSPGCGGIRGGFEKGDQTGPGRVQI